MKTKPIQDVVLMIRKMSPLLLGIFAFAIIVLCICLLNSTREKIIAITDWPENTYTSQIPQPDFGQPSRLISTRDGCGVLLDNCSEEDLNSYVGILYGKGYTMLDTAESDDSKVLLLSNGSVFVQLTLSGKSLLVGLYITMPERS